MRARRLGELAGAKGDCLYWANVQLAYFCGVKNECAPQSLRDDAHGRNALRVASANIQRDFVAVGLVEDLKRSLKLFETVLPQAPRRVETRARESIEDIFGRKGVLGAAGWRLSVRGSRGTRYRACGWRAIL